MNAWPTVILVTSLAVISPGADFALVTRTSLMESRRAGLWVALGIGSGVLIHVAYTLLGLGLVLQRLPWLFDLLRYAGAAYLVWLGISLWRGASRASEGSSKPACGAATGHAAGLSLFALGFVTNVLNPKTALFIISLFMQVVGPAVPMTSQLAYGLFIALTHVLWFALVACFFSTPVLQRRMQAVRPWVDRSLGFVLMGLGGLLIGASTTRQIQF
ncbi:LysE family translocator [Comamonas testosteroni]|uniref:LysE family translocator n=1 Tax=Comamonas testosteroni TaxID=285 RepID=UPI00068109ED|nr:LysE family transporter [Comamonas testosteroni]